MSLTGVSDVVTDRRAGMVSRDGFSPFGATEAHAGAMGTVGAGRCRNAGRRRCSRRTSRSQSGRSLTSLSKRAIGTCPECLERRAAHHRPEPGRLSQDDAEPLVGRWLQHRGDPARRQRPGAIRHSPAPGHRGGADVCEHGHCGDQRATAAARQAVGWSCSKGRDSPLVF